MANPLPQTLAGNRGRYGREGTTLLSGPDVAASAPASTIFYVRDPNTGTWTAHDTVTGQVTVLPGPPPGVQLTQINGAPYDLSPTDVASLPTANLANFPIADLQALPANMGGTDIANFLDLPPSYLNSADVLSPFESSSQLGFDPSISWGTSPSDVAANVGGEMTLAGYYGRPSADLPINYPPNAPTLGEIIANIAAANAAALAPGEPLFVNLSGFKPTTITAGQDEIGKMLSYNRAMLASINDFLTNQAVWASPAPVGPMATVMQLLSPNFTLDDISASGPTSSKFSLGPALPSSDGLDVPWNLATNEFMQPDWLGAGPSDFAFSAPATNEFMQPDWIPTTGTVSANGQANVGAGAQPNFTYSPFDAALSNPPTNESMQPNWIDAISQSPFFGDNAIANFPIIDLGVQDLPAAPGEMSSPGEVTDDPFADPSWTTPVDQSSSGAVTDNPFADPSWLPQDSGPSAAAAAAGSSSNIVGYTPDGQPIYGSKALAPNITGFDPATGQPIYAGIPLTQVLSTPTGNLYSGPSGFMSTGAGGIFGQLSGSAANAIALHGFGSQGDAMMALSEFGGVGSGDSVHSGNIAVSESARAPGDLRRSLNVDTGPAATAAKQYPTAWQWVKANTQGSGFSQKPNPYNAAFGSTPTYPGGGYWSPIMGTTNPALAVPMPTGYGPSNIVPFPNLSPSDAAALLTGTRG